MELPQSWLVLVGENVSYKLQNRWYLFAEEGITEIFQVISS